MIKTLLSGCNGKMGQVIAKSVKEMPDMEITAGLDINDALPNTFPVYTDIENFTAAVDVIIDFSHPAGFDKLLSYAVSKTLPIVVATTGLNQNQIDKLHEASAIIPVFFSANMSLGINLTMDLAGKAAKFLGESFDVEIIEKHHNQKIDAPSGTALAIADAITSATDNSMEYVYDRHSVRRKRTRNEIGIHAIRGGNIVGEHTVIYAGTDEVIEITHKATSKEVFSAGAIRAAEFLVTKPAGMYTMNDLINSK